MRRQPPALYASVSVTPVSSTSCGEKASTRLPTVLCVTKGLASTRPSALAVVVRSALRRARNPIFCCRTRVSCEA